MDNQTLLTQIVNISKIAGQKILEVYNSDEFSVVEKDDKSPLTLADKSSHEVIVSLLSEVIPTYPILSEEGAEIPYETRKEWNRYWLIDPLDGTKEFIKKNGEFTVNIALIEDGVPILGVVHSPVLGTTYYGSNGLGSFKEDANGTVSEITVTMPTDSAQYIVVASRSHRDSNTDELLLKIQEHTCISMGSSLKLCLVAEGSANFYPRLAPTMEWDTAAAHAVVLGAGGVVVDVMGDLLTYNKKDLLNPHFLVLNPRDEELKQAIWTK